MPAIELIRPLRLTPTGGSELTIFNRGSNNVFYGQSSLVSSTNKTGTLAVSESLTLSKGFVWVVAEATPVIVDLKEVEISSGTSEGITKAEADLRYSRLLEPVKKDTSEAEATYKVAEVTTATVTVLTLKRATTTVELPGAAQGKSLIIEVVQDSSGSRLITWSGVTWPGGVAPTLSTGASAVDVLTFMCLDGTHWRGFYPGIGMA